MYQEERDHYNIQLQQDKFNYLLTQLQYGNLRYCMNKKQVSTLLRDEYDKLIVLRRKVSYKRVRFTS